MKQLSLDLPKWGGRRKGAGRPRVRAHPGLEGPGVPHLPRPALASRHPVHVTMRLQPGVGYLRSYRPARAIQEALASARARPGLRVVHYAILGNHLHLIVEAADAQALSRGMQGLATRIARRLNALRRRRGGVFADRYHGHILRSPRETARAVRYVLGNYRHHARESLPRGWTDPLSSAAFAVVRPPSGAPVDAPHTWLLRVGWRSAAP